LVIVGGSHHRFPLASSAVSLFLLYKWLGVSSLVLVAIVAVMTPIIYVICRSVQHFTSTSSFIYCWSDTLISSGFGTATAAIMRLRDERIKKLTEVLQVCTLFLHHIYIDSHTDKDTH
jgi:hypothetical protein